MAEDNETVLDVTIKRKSNKKAGFEVEQREDGFYYITEVPFGFKNIGVGDRVMEINGTSYLNFKDRKHANDLIDCFRLEVIPLDDDEDGSDEEDYEEVNRDRPRGVAGSANRAAGAASSSMKQAYNDDDDNNDDDYEDPADDGRRGMDYRDHDYDDVDDDDRYGRGDDDDEDDEDDDGYYVDEEGRAAARANASKRNIGKKGSKPGDFDRPYISNYNPNDRFMITVTKEYDDEDPGVELVEYKTKRRTEIYVADVARGPFYKTALDRGDKILSINGRKHPKELKSIEQARDLLNLKAKATIFVMRPDPNGDEGYKWVMANT